MSNSTKSILIFLVIVLILLGLWYVLSGKNQPTMSSKESELAATVSSTAQVKPTPADVISQGDNSNTTLDQDLSNIDVQLKAVSTNSGAVDQSFNDKPVAQTE
jgi:hypothetical protein